MTWEDVPEKSREKENLEQVLIAAKRASELVKQILTFSRQGQEEPQYVKVSLIIKEVLKLIRASLPSSIEIRQVFEADTDVIMADPTQMHQVVMNLCTNAGHAMMKQGGLLEITLANAEIDDEKINFKPAIESGTFVKIGIRDTGCGISPLILERIFGPYYTTKNTGGGTGLGLAVVSGIVESNNGTITVESEPGKGTAFHVYLPVATQTAVKINPDDIPIPGGTERVLFVDDEKSLVRMGTLMLEGLGYDVVGATDPVEALNIFKSCCDTIDLVITDQTMPKMTGMELARIFKDIRSDIPVILCTGYSRTVSSEQINAIGIRKSIMKPINIRQIAYIVREVLDDDQDAKEVFN